MGLVGDLGLGWFVVVVAGVWCGFMVGLRELLLLMHDTLSGWLAVGFLVDLEVGFCCCCFELFCFVGPGFLVGVFGAGCFVDLWASGGWFWVFAICVWVSLFRDCLRLTLVIGFCGGYCVLWFGFCNCLY